MTKEDLQELADNYSRMFEADLIDAARAYDELLEPAQALLRAEFAKRGLEPPLAQDASSDEKEEDTASDPVDSASFVTIGRYPEADDANEAQAALDAIGIEAICHDEGTRGLRDWTSGPGVTVLQVAPADEARARTLLSDPTATRKAIESAAAPDRPICPRCDSLNTFMLPHTTEPSTDSILVHSRPKPDQHHGADEWKCNDCGTRWFDDDGIPE